MLELDRAVLVGGLDRGYWLPSFSGATNIIYTQATILCRYIIATNSDGKPIYSLIGTDTRNDRHSAAANMLPSDTSGTPFTGLRPRFALITTSSGGSVSCDAIVQGSKGIATASDYFYADVGGTLEARGPDAVGTQNIVKSATVALRGTASTSVSRTGISTSGATQVILRGVVYATVCSTSSDVANGWCTDKERRSASSGSYRANVELTEYDAAGNLCRNNPPFAAELVPIAGDRHHLTTSLSPQKVDLAGCTAKVTAIMTITHASGPPIRIEADSDLTRIVLEATSP